MISTLTLTYGNRLPHLQNCIRAIKTRTPVDREIIVINNGSEEIKDWLASQHDIKSLSLEENEGVCARNYGIDMAQGELIVQVDDDVVVLDGWTDHVLPMFKDPKVGGVGVQGACFDGWLNYNHDNIKPGDYVDFLTGFFWVFRNCGIKYDKVMGKFWHEESEMNLQLKAAGYRLRVCSPVVSHNCQRREEVDWDLHNKNLDYVIQKWKGQEDKLNFERWRRNENKSS